MDKNQTIKDFQSQQKHIGTSYYTFANECANPNLRIDFLAFAREESDIISWLDYEYDEGKKPEYDYVTKEQKELAYNSYNTGSLN